MCSLPNNIEQNAKSPVINTRTLQVHTQSQPATSALPNMVESLVCSLRGGALKTVRRPLAPSVICFKLALRGGPTVFFQDFVSVLVAIKMPTRKTVDPMCSPSSLHKKQIDLRSCTVLTPVYYIMHGSKAFFTLHAFCMQGENPVHVQLSQMIVCAFYRTNFNSHIAVSLLDVDCFLILLSLHC